MIGGGPAGIAAAVRAAESGVLVGLVDDNLTLGGQIWRNPIQGQSPVPQASEWRERLQRTNASVICGKRVFQQPEPGVLLAEGADDLLELRYRNLVLATGARERFLPFPGWTLPNVMGAGGLQAMVKSGLPIQGKRVVVAGTGPLLLAVGAYLQAHGAKVPVICEQASWNKLALFAMVLWMRPQKIAQALQLKRELAGVLFVANSWVLAAHGRSSLERITISRNGYRQDIGCDYLACGFHVVPNTELADLLGCSTRDGFVQVDQLQRTTLPHVFCAGEPTGIGGVELSLIEGQIAGLGAAGRMAEAKELFAKRKSYQRFAGLLGRTFALRPELRMLAAAETIVCRCEDVPYSRLREHTSWRAAKLHSRCGMGPCQARVCGPACDFLFGWKPDSVRPPLFPARVASLADITGTVSLEHGGGNETRAG